MTNTQQWAMTKRSTWVTIETSKNTKYSHTKKTLGRYIQLNINMNLNVTSMRNGYKQASELWMEAAILCEECLWLDNIESVISWKWAAGVSNSGETKCCWGRSCRNGMLGHGFVTPEVLYLYQEHDCTTLWNTAVPVPGATHFAIFNITNNKENMIVRQFFYFSCHTKRTIMQSNPFFKESNE